MYWLTLRHWILRSGNNTLFTRCSLFRAAVSAHRALLVLSACHTLVLWTCLLWTNKVLMMITAANCGSTDFRCANGIQCIRLCARCDGVFDCSDSSDELNCSKWRTQFVCCRYFCRLFSIYPLFQHNFIVIVVNIITMIYSFISGWK